MKATIKTHLPESVKAFHYVSNSHDIELTDENKNIIKLIATGLIRGKCESCNQVIYVESVIGEMICPHCMSSSIKWTWEQLQIGFVPEEKSEFMAFDLGKTYPE